MNEFETKQARIQEFLAAHNLDALALRRVSSFAWATCGAASYINTAASEGIATLFITDAARYLIINNIEAPRLEQEEALGAQGWQWMVSRWYETEASVAELARGLKVGADFALPGAVEVSDDLARLRARLLPQETARFGELGKICGAACRAAARAVRPGMSEYEIAAQLAQESEARGAQCIVNLIATDARIFNFRHPLPTARKLERYAMLVLCARKWGLVASATRLVHFGALPEELKQKADAVARVDAAFIAATRPGRTLGEIFQRARQAYAATGFADEWQYHHQGGAAGYEPREYVATPGSSDVVVLGQAFAWNPSIAGAKSEDTILVGAETNEIVTLTDDWQTVDVKVEDQIIRRPAILVM